MTADGAYRFPAKGALLAAAAAICLPLVGSAGAAQSARAAASSWVCAYARDANGHAIGSGCMSGTHARVCDSKADGRTVYGTFGVRSVGLRTFADGNGSKAPCSYRTYSHTVVAVSAYSRR